MSGKEHNKQRPRVILHRGRRNFPLLKHERGNLCCRTGARNLGAIAVTIVGSAYDGPAPSVTRDTKDSETQAEALRLLSAQRLWYSSVRCTSHRSGPPFRYFTVQFGFSSKNAWNISATICCVLNFVRLEQEMSEIFRQIGRGNPIGDRCGHRDSMRQGLWGKMLFVLSHWKGHWQLFQNTEL